MGNTLKVKYKFGAWQILLKNVWFKYFLFPYEIWAENNNQSDNYLMVCEMSASIYP